MVSLSGEIAEQSFPKPRFADGDTHRNEVRADLLLSLFIFWQPTLCSSLFALEI